ncbi:uncharacterized protein PV09_07259 [Verruconis gallopava]|uniref:Uncharacterized protein n=1 Tax=Verruconis gallopava TaxID=253628 RepID=A0A0D1YK15_9PEZI|nr:uncharacterized protein PV09_07259 [Verruconis gallopava]KIW01212.1 hypothetical protein PV09_07259 [Verruconis gallopava]
MFAPHAPLSSGGRSHFSFEMVEKPEQDVQQLATARAANVETHVQNTVHHPSAVFNTIDQVKGHVARSARENATKAHDRRVPTNEAAAKSPVAVYQFAHHLQVPATSYRVDPASALNSLQQASSNSKDQQIYQWLLGFHREDEVVFSTADQAIPVALNTRRHGQTPDDQRVRDAGEESYTYDLLREIGAWV